MDGFTSVTHNLESSEVNQSGETLVEVHSDAGTLPFVLLTPGLHPPRQGSTFQLLATYRDIPWILESAAKSQFLAVDLETRGGDYSGDIDIIGIGLAWDTGSCYLHWADLFPSSRSRIAAALLHHPGVIAHNVYFDGGVIRRLWERHANWYACTYALYAYLANESPERKWGLKAAQTELLGWESSNEGELDEWLVTNGYYIGNRRLDGSPEYLLSEFQQGKLKPDKGEMWRAPPDVLGKYCVLDAEACYLLFTEVLNPVYQKFPGLQQLFPEVMREIEILIDQRLHGILVDRDGLRSRSAALLAEISQLEQKFLEHSQTKNHIREIEMHLILPLRESEPEKYLKQKWPTEPPKFRKDGSMSKSWQNWKQKTDEMRRLGPELSKNWTNWQARLTSAIEGTNPDYRFNVNSGPQLRELLYEKLKFEPRIYTETGLPAIGHKAYKHMGELGRILSERADLVKELSYVDKYIELVAAGRDTIHPSYRAPGTVTGRLSSKEPNMQQIPKTRAMMSLFHARPGHVWVDLDFSALEPVVLTEFSQDENLLRIYGDAAPKNDIYLYVAASIPTYRSQILATGYDPLNPRPEALASAKRDCKGIRSICKTVVLACQYGAGVNKVMQTLEQDDVFLSYEEVEAIHSGYWNLFAKVRDFQRALWYEWRRNTGYILNGLGRPMCVPEDYTKDLLNRFVQSTGHDILTKYITLLSQRLDDNDIPWSPIIIDFHDATTVEVPEEHAELTVRMFEASMDDLNYLLQGTVKLRGVPTVGVNLADVKEPEE